MSEPTQPLADAADYSAFFTSERGRRIWADLQRVFEFYHPTYRVEEIANLPADSASLSAAYRDGAHTVLKHIQANGKLNLS